ncbi:MAG TPA: hypothetical protein VH105_25790, partial [Burkholderiales bacterium]|nr:hypothetical protein [Burkholderiales bacterium]
MNSSHARRARPMLPWRSLLRAPMRAAAIVSLAALALCSPRTARAQAADFPNKPIRLINGTSPDLLARVLAAKIQAD